MSDTKSVLVIDGNIVGDVFQNATKDYVEVTADGVKTYGTLFNELFALIDMSKININSKILQSSSSNSVFHIDYIATSSIKFVWNSIYSQKGIIQEYVLSNNSSLLQWYNNTYTDVTSSIPHSGIKFTLYYGSASVKADFETHANKCIMSDGRTVQEKIVSIDLGSFADLTSLETAIKNKLATMKKGDILTGVFSTTQSFAPFNITGGQSIIIQSRGDNISTIGMIQVWNQLGYMHYGFCSNGTFTWKKPTLT